MAEAVVEEIVSLSDEVQPRQLRPAAAPLAILAISLSIGILADYFANIAWSHWLFGSTLLILGWMLASWKRLHRAGSLLVILTWIAVGGGLHHSSWSVAARNDVVFYATETPAPINLVATIQSRPSVRPAEDAATAVLPSVDRTQCIVRVRSLQIGEQERPASGLVQLIVSGHLATSQAGDLVRIRGKISRPRAPGNPGEFDYRQYLRRQKIHCVVRADDPASLETIARVQATDIRWWRNRARRIATDILFTALDEDIYPIAAAILLGDRDYVTRSLRASFTESGTMHLLAISGLHVGILALFLWQLARLLHLPLRFEVLLVVATILVYVVVTDIRPSVLRAGVLAVSLMTGRVWYRKLSLANSLGMAAVIVLLINPTDLFDVGAQLSFLAVSGIAWVNVAFPRKIPPTDVLDPVWKTWLKRLLSRLISDFRMMFAVTIVTAPLVAHSFHLYAPVGLAINVLLIHLVFIIMIAGYLTLLVGYFAPPAAVLPASLFAAGLRVLKWTAEAASSISLGHRYGPGPSTGWVLGFYTLFVILLLARTTTWRMRIICGMLIWVLVGLVPASFRQHEEHLRCTFLDVGHGLCILVENPEGQTLLVDVGSMDSALRASRAVQGCLWNRGYACLDTLAITHADLDHFNGTSELLKETKVGGLIVPQSFVESVEDGAISVRETVAGLGIPITTVQRGQPLKFGSVSISVLHPGVSATNEFEDDNASSIVLLLEYAGKRILLTGDVSGTGQRNLMSKTIEPVDVLLAPHHGSKSDNTAELDQWASPGVVVASSRSRSTKKLAAVYPSSRLYTTGRDGAITCIVSSTGELSVSAFRDELPTWLQSPRTIGRLFENNQPD